MVNIGPPTCFASMYNEWGFDFQLINVPHSPFSVRTEEKGFKWHTDPKFCAKKKTHKDIDI